MNIKHLAVCMGVALMAVACGDDDDDSKPAAQTATVDQGQAKANAQATISALSATLNGGENGASVGALSGAAQSSQGLLSYQPGAAGTRSVAQGLNLETGGVHPLDIGDPGCSCTGTSCTFSSCSFGSASTTFKIDGSYSWGGGHVVCNNLKYTFESTNDVASSGAAGYATNMVVTLNCDLTVTETSINGYIQSAGNTSSSLGGQTYATTWDIRSTYNNVTFNASHQATGGSLAVNGTASVSAGGQTYNYAGSGEVTFP